MLPIFLKLDGRRCLLVGAGNVALDKIGSLLKTGLSLRVVAPQARPEVRQLAAEGKLEWIERGFAATDLDGLLADVDAISIVTPDRFHAEPTIAALNAGDGLEIAQVLQIAGFKRGKVAIQNPRVLISHAETNARVGIGQYGTSNLGITL